MRNVVFCTAFVPRYGDPYYTWNVRYRIWLEAVRRSSLQADQIVLVDDGSEILPDWPDATIIQEGDSLRTDAPVVVYHFDKRLGRQGVSDFPGWVRSFFFMSSFAEANGIRKIVHIEADAFLISPRIVDYVNRLDDGWTTFWCPKYLRPESGLQIIAGSGLETFQQWARKPIDSFAGCVIEKTLPFSHVERRFVGDRYSEGELTRVPRDAEWCMQAKPLSHSDYTSYFWWMPWFDEALPELAAQGGAMLIPNPGGNLAHNGLYYVDWLQGAEHMLQPKTYFEIGTHTGDSLKAIGCDAVCVDSRFAVNADVIGRKRNTHFFQGTPDEFFADQSLVSRVVPSGVELAFLDGLHLYEVLLRDFFNTEAIMSPDGMIVLHDCLPLNSRMAERDRRAGTDDEPAEIRDFWTGDVWKVVVVLKAFRPDLRIRYVNCPPTGLVVVTGLDPKNRVLRTSYREITDRYDSLDLNAYGFEKLWNLCPMYHAERTVTAHEDFTTAFYQAG